MRRFRTSPLIALSAVACLGALLLPLEARADDDPFAKAARDGNGARLTADEVGKRAALTSYSAKAQESALKAAAARVDQSWSAFLPRIGLLAPWIVTARSHC